MLAIKLQRHEWICQQVVIGVDVLASDVGTMQKKTFKKNAAVITRVEGIGGTCTVYAEIVFSFTFVCYMYFTVQIWHSNTGTCTHVQYRYTSPVQGKNIGS